MITILPDTLRTYRKKCGFSQKKLAYHTEGLGSDRVSLGTIKEIERKKTPHQSHLGTAKSLADALGIAPDDLSHPYDEQKTPKDKSITGYRAYKHAVSGEKHLALDLVAARYKIPPSGLLELAPLLAVLVFEQSLAERKKKLDEVIQAEAELSSLAGHGSGHLSFAHYTSDVTEGIFRERKSIQDRDIFGKQLQADDGFNTDFDIDSSNPFAEFLQSCANQLGDTGVEFGDLIGDLPSYNLFEDFLQGIVGNSDRARFALTNGFARVFDVPNKLRKKEQSQARIEWLENCVPDTEWSERESYINDLISSLEI